MIFKRVVYDVFDADGVLLDTFINQWVAQAAADLLSADCTVCRVQDNYFGVVPRVVPRWGRRK